MTDSFPIDVVNLRKEYKGFVAVDDLNLKVQRNSFTGLLGPNGAGKSTTLKILTNLINATSGNAYLNGIDVTKDSKAALIGVGTVVETPEFYGYLTPKETFSYIGELFGMTSESISSETDEILDKVKMTEWGDKKLSTFSKGMRQRIALGLSLLNEPSIIILDEPTSGLDPRGMAETREILKNIRVNSKDLTILMSSHVLHEVNDLCDHVAIINHGKLLIQDRTEAVTHLNKIRKLSLNVVGGPNDSVVERISSIPNVKKAYIETKNIMIMFEGDDKDQAGFLDDISRLNIGAYNLNEEDALENVYLNMIKETR
jgi:ABC-2 type transport system ATP-binding protein